MLQVQDVAGRAIAIVLSPLMATTQEPLGSTLAPPPSEVAAFGGDDETIVCLWQRNREGPLVPLVDVPTTGSPAQIATHPQLIVPGGDSQTDTRIMLIPRPSSKELDDFEIAGFQRIPLRPKLSRPGLVEACRRLIDGVETQNGQPARTTRRPRRVRAQTSTRQPAAHQVPAMAG